MALGFDSLENAMKHCLIVDDSRVIRKVARKILEDLQFTIDEAEEGGAALELCRRSMPDAVLLDGHMPNMSGIEFLRALRREMGGAKPVVVLLHHRKRHRLHHRSDRRGRQRICPEAVQHAKSCKAKFTEAGLM